MRSHRRKWGWWLVAAIAVVLAASLLYHRYAGAPSAEPDVSATDSLAEAPIVRDTVYIKVDGETVPVVRERPAGRQGEVSTPASAETVVSIPLKDINSLVRGKSGKDVQISTQAPDRISVSYSGTVDIPLLGAQDMDLSADFKVIEAKGDRLVLQIDSGTAKNVLADMFSSTIMDHLPKGLVESFSGGRAVVNLSAVPELKKRLTGVDLTGFAVDEDGISLTTVPRP